MLGSGYQSVMESDLLREGWSKWADVDAILDAWGKATNFADVVPAVYEHWYPRWSDAMNVELTACLQGKISADGGLRHMTAQIGRAKQGAGADLAAAHLRLRRESGPAVRRRPPPPWPSERKWGRGSSPWCSTRRRPCASR